MSYLSLSPERDHSKIGHKKKLSAEALTERRRLQSRWFEPFKCFKSIIFNVLNAWNLWKELNGRAARCLCLYGERLSFACAGLFHWKE
jgi:hypothetical protein